MKIETKEIYKCDHCNKLYQIKSACVKHEEACSKSMVNQRPCFSCHNLIKKETTIYDDNWDGSESSKTVNLFYCENKKHFLYTPQNEIKQNRFELGDEENVPMPKQCDVYNDDSFDSFNIFN
jgi:hypothetical protein